jgi:hypothetical protein
VSIALRTLSLTCSAFYVDARITAVEPFEGMVDELLACLSPDLAPWGLR